MADCLPVVLRKTCCFFLCSSQVRNFSCSAWNNLTTSPCQSPEHSISRDRDVTHQWTSYKQVKFWALPLWGCHLYYRSISWKGLFSSLYCNSQSWPKRRNRTVSPTALCLHKLLPQNYCLIFLTCCSGYYKPCCFTLDKTTSAPAPEKSNYRSDSPVSHAPQSHGYWSWRIISFLPNQKNRPNFNLCSVYKRYKGSLAKTLRRWVTR